MTPAPTPPEAPFAPAPFVAVRAPTLPVDVWARLSEGLVAPGAVDGDLADALAHDRAAVTMQLRGLLDDPTVREAIRLASPSLDAAVDAWRAAPDAPEGLAAAAAAFRYATRMATRATPFGLFAAHGLGAPGDVTRVVAPGVRATRRVRLDAQYLSALVAALERDPSLRPRLRFEVTNAAYASGGQVRYAEARVDPATRERRNDTVSVESSEALRAVLGRRAPATLDEVAALVAERESVGRDEARAYVDELADAGLIASELALALTGPEALDALLATLTRVCPEHPARATLMDVRDALAALARSPLGAARGRYEAVARALDALPCAVDRARLFQVDLHGDGGTTVSAGLLRDVEAAVRALAAIVPWREDPDLTRFRERFVARWEGAAVPLAMALDEERGVGFGADAEGAQPLLAGIEARGEPAPAPAVGARERWMLSRVRSLAGRQAWTLDARDLERLRVEGGAPMPDSFAVMATALEGEGGGASVLVEHASGPSGARLLGRFCHGDPRLAEVVRAHLRGEEALRPEAVFAEVVHLPQGRLGNIAARPALRDWEIPYLCRAGVDAAHQLPIDDLLVRVAPDGRVALWSPRLGREVIPRMTNAHNHAAAELPIYRFLCALVGQGVRGGLAWSWGALESAPYLPRVVLGRAIVSLATWNVDPADLAPLAKLDEASRLRGLRRLRAAAGLPREVAACDGDNVLPLDLENPLAVDALFDLARGASGTLRLREVLAPSAVAEAPGGRHAHELVIPFLRRVAPPRAPLSAPDAGACRRFAPGSEWLYAKVYTGALTADAVLAEVVGPLVRAMRSRGVIDGWFFVRYADPDPHLRLRFHGAPGALLGALLPALHDALAPWLDDGRVARVALDTYVREVERYGGPEGIAPCEAIFEADSDAAVAVIASTRRDDGADARWRRCLRGLDTLLSDLGYDRASAASLLESQRDAWARRLGLGRDAEGSISRRFRAERAALEALLRGASEEDEAPWARRAAVVAPRASSLRATAADGFDELAASLAHMSVNRVMSGAPNLHEVVLYDLLARLYRSEAARASRPR